ncbi:MAG: hypothetical protein GY724_08465 [Actinomycetia bacterium]|nr:hypothetical protein [Actinomycetes bacterium]MCP4226064.1 hypothetical protein [Actinomycetes bacterium]
MSALIVIILVVMTGCVAVVVNLVRAPVEAANSFVAHIDDGEIKAAYNSLCRTTRSELTLDEFTDHYSAAGGITGYTLAPASSAIGELTTVSGTIEINDEPRNVNFSLVRENDEWRVCSYDLLQ